MKEFKRYNGFRWYLPKFFKDSLSKCRFEQGTIIYKDELIGEKWGEQIDHIDYLIQIQYPPSSMSSGNGDESVIKANWETEVEFVRFYPKSNRKEFVKTTQGRLFTFLWKDLPEILDKNIPLLPPLFKLSNSSINENFIIENVPANCVGFAFVYNSVNDILISKLNSIILKAEVDFKVEELTFSIEEACINLELEGTNGVYPLLCVKLLLFKSAKIDVINDLIKSALYKGKMGQFSIKTHGFLIQQ